MKCTRRHMQGAEASPAGEAVAEAVRELGKVPRHMLGSALVVGAMKGALDVTKNRVAPSQRGIPGACRCTSGYELQGNVEFSYEHRGTKATR